MAKEYDVVIIGGGPGGYVAAIRASQLGLTTAVIEKSKVGGTCLHAGCIPSKALLRSAEVYANTKHGEQFGVIAPEVSLDFSKVQSRKEEITDRLFKGIQHLLKKGKIDVYEGKGSISEAKDVLIETSDGEQITLHSKNILIATGSRPRTLPGLEADGQYVMTSDEALQMETLPSSIIIVGGGVIGIEWASMLNDFGVKVTVVEYADRILPTEDKDVSKEVQRLMKKKGVKIVTGAKVLPDTLEKGEGVAITAEHKGKETQFSADKLLVSVGRVPNTSGIGLENQNINVDRLFIKTNENYQTSEPTIYAIGDVIGGLQLAHVASHEGIIAIEHMAGKETSPLDLTLVPKCVYSNPEVASVGLTEEEAKEKGFEVKIGKFPFRAIGKALVYGESDGFVKLIVEETTNKLLGAHMVGPHVTDMITELGLAHVLNATSMDISHTIHPHPALSEAIGEAALAIDGKEIHA
ncbi:dihydrolipoyl dehydrogenase [Anaerobacillus sp. MEB173]|uniref:dihydrolipoyl dehydrogenase n=1 Tax=Anaerobacillus sp. MEB173 TaxID=3383345 RepID=UPI003F8FB0AF